VTDERVKELAALLPDKPQGFGRPISHRDAWDRLAQYTPCRKVIVEAEKLLGEAIPQFDQELFKAYFRTGGNREHDQRMGLRRQRLDTLVKAECLENKGRFVRTIEEYIKAICGDVTWVSQGHDINFYNIDGLRYEIELRTAELARKLATIDYVLGDKLTDSTRRLIRQEVNKRALEPFLAMLRTGEKRAFWLERTSNWNAVCLSGVAGAALTLLESPEERALVLAGVEHYIQNYLKGFIDDGFCVEGISYWNFGFRNYIVLAQTIKEATGGRIDMLEGAKIRKVAQMPFRVEMLPGVYPYFSDCRFGYRPEERTLAFVSRRYGLGYQTYEQAFSEPYCGYDMDILSSLCNSQRVEADEPPPIEMRRTWFDKHGVVICRPGPEKACRIAVAVKGGHNDEEKHNHNDVGTFVVAAGKESLIIDPGLELYTARSTSPNRYDSKILSSYGHCVPVVAGQFQSQGRKAQARVVKTEFTPNKDTLVLEISSAYPVTQLEKLQRTYTYRRDGAGSLTVVDEVGFSEPQSFGTALITLSQWEQLDSDSLLMRGEAERLQVDIEASGEFEIEANEIHENMPNDLVPIRLGINLKKPVREAAIKVTIYPAQAEQE